MGSRREIPLEVEACILDVPYGEQGGIVQAYEARVRFRLDYGWESSPVEVTPWLVTEHAHLLSKFWVRHKRWPGVGDYSYDRDLALWLDRTRRRAAGTGPLPWSDELQQIMDVIAPGWQDSKPVFERDDARFLQRAREVAAYVEQTGELPSQFAPGGAWLNNVRMASHGRQGYTWSDERRQIMDDVVPGWDAARRISLDDDAVRDRAARIAGYREITGRWPQPKAPDPEVQFLGSWLTRARRAARGLGTLQWTDEWQRIMDDIVPGWQNTSR